MCSYKSPVKAPPAKATSDKNIKQLIKYLLIYSIQSVFASRSKTGKYKTGFVTHQSSNNYIWFGLNIPLNEGMTIYLKESLINVVNQIVDYSGNDNFPLHIEVLARCGSESPILLEQWTFYYEKKSNETTSKAHIFLQLSNVIRCIISTLRISPVYYRYFRALPTNGDWAFLRIRREKNDSESFVSKDATFSKQLIGKVVDFHHYLTVSYTFRNELYNFTELIEHVIESCEEYARSKMRKLAVKFKRSEGRDYYGNIKFGHLTRFRDEICKNARCVIGRSLEMPDFYYLEDQYNAFNMPKEEDQIYVENFFTSVSNLFVEFYPLSIRKPSFMSNPTVNSTKGVLKSIEQTISKLKELGDKFDVLSQETQFDISD